MLANLPRDCEFLKLFNFHPHNSTKGVALGYSVNTPIYATEKTKELIKEETYCKVARLIAEHVFKKKNDSQTVLRRFVSN